MILALAFFGGLAAAALWACWHDQDLRWLAAALCAGFAASNVVWFFGSIEMRPAAFSLVEVVVLITAFMAWKESGYRTLIALVAVSVLSICSNIVFASIIDPTNQQINIWEIVANICFGAECFLAMGTGIADGYRAHRFGAGSVGRRRRAQLHAARSARRKAP